jgi:hypothetical protein
MAHTGCESREKIHANIRLVPRFLRCRTTAVFVFDSGSRIEPGSAVRHLSGRATKFSDKLCGIGTSRDAFLGMADAYPHALIDVQTSRSGHARVGRAGVSIETRNEEHK